MSGAANDKKPIIGINVPSIISFFLLGAVNGLVTGGILGMSGGVSASAGGGTLILASVAGVVGLFATSLVGMLFPKYVEGDHRMSFVAKNAAGDWSLTKTGSIVVAGIANGLFFWALHSLAFFQGAGFFGNALAGALSLMGYAVVVQPLMGSLSKVAA